MGKEIKGKSPILKELKGLSGFRQISKDQRKFLKKKKKISKHPMAKS